MSATTLLCGAMVALDSSDPWFREIIGVLPAAWAFPACRGLHPLPKKKKKLHASDTFLCTFVGSVIVVSRGHSLVTRCSPPFFFFWKMLEEAQGMSARRFSRCLCSSCWFMGVTRCDVVKGVRNDHHNLISLYSDVM